jgi:ribosomal protein L37AE/L43A
LIILHALNSRMLPPPPGGRITFFEVVRKTRYKYLYVIAPVLLLVGISFASALSSMSPRELKGSAQNVRSDFEVKESTEGPAILTISHTFELAIDESHHYKIVNGPPMVDYSARITSSEGKELYNWTTTLDLPYMISDYGGGDSYTKTDTTELELPIGKYTLTLSADLPVDYQLDQKNRLEAPLFCAELLAFIGVLLLALSLILTLNTRKALNTSWAIAALSNPSGSPAYRYGSRAMYQAYNPAASKYEVEREAVDYICAKCGNIIQNPVVQNVISCEKCGEKEYVG